MAPKRSKSRACVYLSELGQEALTASASSTRSSCCWMLTWRLLRPMALPRPIQRVRSTDRARITLVDRYATLISASPLVHPFKSNHRQTSRGIASWRQRQRGSRPAPPPYLTSRPAGQWVRSAIAAWRQREGGDDSSSSSDGGGDHRARRRGRMDRHRMRPPYGGVSGGGGGRARHAPPQ